MAHPRLIVDLKALGANFQTLAAAAQPGQCGAVVKANGYGVGADRVAQYLHGLGCDTFFVATPAEAETLRAVLADVKIYVFAGVIDDADCQRLLAADSRPILNDAHQAELWRGRGPCALHLDTGMNRLGFPPGTALPLTGVELVLTHFACADDPAHPLNQLQQERFSQRIENLNLPTSLGNSAAILNGWSGDLARPGIALYGANPYADGRSTAIVPVATLRAPVLQVRKLDAPMSVGYGARAELPAGSTVATVGMGYADGYRRVLGNRAEVAFGGQRAPVIGPVSMDLITVRMDDMHVQPGDEVELFGETVTLEEVAGWADTLPYEILTGIGTRVVREYLD